MDNADVNGVQILYNALTVLQKLANSFDCAVIYANLFYLLMAMMNEMNRFFVDFILLFCAFRFW